MIVISGALVLVALVLLVIGLVGPSLPFVYASIGASLAAFAFLVFGVLQRRKEEAVVDGAPSSAADIAAAIRTPDTRAVVAEGVAAPGLAGEVLVVEGRPRYHVAGCRYLTGKDARGVEVGQARADGFTACGVCKPDEVLAAAPAPVEAPVVADDAHVAIVEPVAEEVGTVTVADKAPAKRTVAKKSSPATKAPVKAARAAAPAKAATAAKPATAAAPAKAAPVKKATVATKAAAKAAPVRAAAKAPAKAATKAATKAPGKAPAKKAVVAVKAPAKKTASKAPAKKAPAKRA